MSERKSGYIPDGGEAERFAKIDEAMEKAGIARNDYMPSLDGKIVFIKRSALPSEKANEPHEGFACDPYPWKDEWPSVPSRNQENRVPQQDPYFPLPEEGDMR